MAKFIEKELKEINPIDLIGPIILIGLAFFIPVLGIIFPLIFLIKYSESGYPNWLSYAAIASVIFQVVMIAILILTFPASSVQTEKIENVVIEQTVNSQ